MSTNKSTKSAKRKTSNSPTHKQSVKKSHIKYVKSDKKCAKPNRPLCLIVIIIFGVAALVAVTFITIFSALRTSDSSLVSHKTDAQKFASEYTEVGTDNVFVYKSSQEIIDILEHGTGVVFLGFPSCPWCQRYAKYLNEVAKGQGLKQIYYHDIYEDRKNNTEDYQKITALLGTNLQYDNEGHRYLYVPDATFIISGTLIGNDFETSKDTGGVSSPDEYWTEDRVNSLKARLTGFIQPIVAQEEDCDSTCDR
ncbi:hypothetical protein IJG78_03845 [Candidatus Saccharibacteria bacterium]|nr:hypothetical protein [Candidatus Saccharibacteria bacterium]